MDVEVRHYFAKRKSVNPLGWNQSADALGNALKYFSISCTFALSRVSHVQKVPFGFDQDVTNDVCFGGMSNQPIVILEYWLGIFLPIADRAGLI